MKYIFAVIIFIITLSVVIHLHRQAKRTSKHYWRLCEWINFPFNYFYYKYSVKGLTDAELLSLFDKLSKVDYWILTSKYMMIVASELVIRGIKIK